MQYTDVFGFKKPEYAEEADVVDLNDNMDDIDDTLYKIRRLSGLVYDANTTSSNPYVAGNYTINPTDGLMYKCTDTTYGAWDSTKWTRTDEFSEIELAMQSGGGGGGSAYAETTLWSGTETPGTGGADINLSGNISDYDMIAIHVGNSSYTGDNIFLVSNLTIGETYISTLYHGENLGAFFTYTSDTQINIKSQGSSYPQTYTKVVGISFGSGGGSGSGYSETNLYTASDTSFVDIPLTWNWADYDAYLFFCNDVNSQTGNPWFVSQGVLTSLIGTQTTLTFYPYSNASVHYYVTANQLTAQSQSQGFYIRQIVGLNFGSGGGSSSGGTQYDTTEQVIGTWVDGRDVYRKLVPVNATWQNIGTGSNQSFVYQENWVKDIDYVTNAIAVSSEQYYANMMHISVQTDKVNGSAVAYWNDAFGGAFTSMYVDYVILEYVKVIPSTST